MYRLIRKVRRLLSSAINGDLWRRSEPVRPDSIAPTVAQAGVDAAAEVAVAPVRPDWEAMPDTDEVWRGVPGWVHGSVADKQIAGWPDFLAGAEGTAPLGVPAVITPETALDVSVHNTLMIFAYVLGRAHSEAAGPRVSVLDWGGGIGQYYRYALAFYPTVDWDYVVKEVGPLVEAGQARNPGARFTDDEDHALSRHYDLVFASGSIMYLRDLYACLGRICDSASRYLYVTRTPFVEQYDDFVVVQRPYRYGYDTEYAGWFLNVGRFLRFVTERGFTLVREFPLSERPHVPNAPEQCRYRSFLFRRVAPSGGSSNATPAELA